MGRPSAEKETGAPERLVARLLGHLKWHALWDTILIFFPPLVVFFYLGIFLYHSTLRTYGTLIFAGAAVLGITLLLGILRYLPPSLSLRFAARLIDERVEGKERFVTLATIDASFCPPFFVNRLRHEAATFLHRIDPKKDFPYRVKRSFFVSLIGSLAVILLFHLLLQIALFFAPQAPPVKELGGLAQKLSQVPRFAELARRLEGLSARLQEQGLSNEEKRSLIQDLLREVENQLAVERQERGAGNNPLSQVANALRGLEEGLEKGREQGDGGLKTNLPQRGEGGGKESGKGSRGEGQGELSALGSKDLTGGQSNLGEKQEAKKRQGEKDQGRGDRPGKEKGREMEGMAKGESEGKGGKSQGEEIPRGTAPAERFLQPGKQGEKGLKGARFVTVELPEEAEGSAPEGGPGKRRELRPKVPVSNVPLRRPDSPEVSTEKQPLPLQYRGLIR